MRCPGTAAQSRTLPIPAHASASQYPPSRPPQRSLGPSDRSTWAPSGNDSNSFSAALIHEMGRVCRVIGCLLVYFLTSLMLSYVTRDVKPSRHPTFSSHPSVTTITD